MGLISNCVIVVIVVVVVVVVIIIIIIIIIWRNQPIIHFRAVLIFQAILSSSFQTLHDPYLIRGRMQPASHNCQSADSGYTLIFMQYVNKQWTVS
jgi:hypothetical protein